MRKSVELDTGMAIEFFSKKKINKLIKKGKTFMIEVPTVISREHLSIKVKIKKNHLDLIVHCTGIEEGHGDQNTVYECEKDAGKIHDKLWYLLTKVYT